jgi:hypothetical protein
MFDYNKYDEEIFNKVYNEIKTMMEKIIKDLSINKDSLTLISGMARGVDEIFTLYAIKNNFKLFASIPYSLSWHKARNGSAINYDEILNYAKKQQDSKKYKKVIKIYQVLFFARNQYMVDMADMVISYLKYPSSRTFDTIKRAKDAYKYYGNITDILK